MYSSDLHSRPLSIDATPPLATRAAISAAAQNMAVLKNVPLTAKELPKFIDLLVAEMGLAHIMFACMDPEVVAARSRVVNQQLDVLAVARVMELVAGVEGKTNLHDPVVQAVVREIMENFEKNVDMANLRWPTTLEMVEGHYAGKLRGPTVAVREDGTVVTRWWKRLEMHRDPSVGPASIEVRGSYRREEYWVEGKRHRPWQDGPAIVIIDDVEGKQRREEAYWFEGKRHRPHTEGPAFRTTHYGDNANLSGEEYFEHGKEHRPSHLGPAVTNWDCTGRKVLEQFMEAGELHREPKEGPASFMIRDPVTLLGAEDNITVIRYCVRGQEHRDEGEGPAVTRIHNDTGTVEEEFWRHGMIHREVGPASIDRGTEYLREVWYRDGKMHRAHGAGPAYVSRSENWLCEQWYLDGISHRDPAEGPALVVHDGREGTVLVQFWVNGECYPKDGPHSVKRDQHGNVIEELIRVDDEFRPYVRDLNAGSAQHV